MLLKCKLTQREEMERKPAEQIITAVLVFFSRFRFSLSSEIKYCKSIFQHIVRESFFGIVWFKGGQTFRTKGRIAKNFEAEGRAD